MKKLSFLRNIGLALLSGLFLLASCTTMESPINGATALKVVSEAGNPVLVPVTGTPTQQKITVTSNTEWAVMLTGEVSFVDWIEINNDGGNAGTTNFMYGVDKNPTDNSREAVFTFVSGIGENVQYAKVVIKQEGSKFEFSTSATNDEVQVLPSGEEGDLQIIRSTREWTAESDSDWLKIKLGKKDVAGSWGSTISGTPVNADPNTIDPANYFDFSWKAEANPEDTKTREAKVTFRCGVGHEHVVTFIQAPAAISIVTPASAILAPISCEGVDFADGITFTIKSNRSWTATPADSWLSVEPATGEKGDNIVIKVAAEPYSNDKVDRTSQIVLEAGKAKAILYVTQSKAGLVIDPSFFDPTENTYLIDVPVYEEAAEYGDIYSTNGLDLSFQILPYIPGDVTPNWFTVEQVKANKTIKITNQPNSSYKVRLAKVIVTCGDMEATIIIRQAAAGFTTVPEKVLVMPSKENTMDIDVSLDSKVKWYVSIQRYAEKDVDPANWLSVTPVESEVDATLKVTAKPNPSGTIRKAFVNISTGTDESDVFKQILIEQAGAILTIDNSPRTFGPEGSTTDFDIAVSCDSQMEIDYALKYANASEINWMYVDKVYKPEPKQSGFIAAGIGSGTISVNAVENHNPERKGWLEVTCGDLKAQIDFTQKEAGSIVIKNSVITLGAHKDKTYEKNTQETDVTLSDNAIPAVLSGAPAWLEVSLDAYTNTTTTRKTKFHATAIEYNPDATPRTAVIVIACGDMKDSLSVTQAGATFSLTKSNDNWVSKAGNKDYDNFIISNIINDVTWSIAKKDDTQAWFTMTGKSTLGATGVSANKLETKWDINDTKRPREAVGLVTLEGTSFKPIEFVCMQDAGHLKFNAGIVTPKEVESKADEYTWVDPIDANGTKDWEIKKVDENDTWYTVTKDGDDIKFVVEANPNDHKRSSKIRVSYGEFTLDFTLIQKAAVFTLWQHKHYLPVYGYQRNDITKFEIPNETGDAITTDNGMGWEIVGATNGILVKDWFTVKVEDDTHIKFYDVDYNRIGQERYATIEFKNGNIVRTLVVAQISATIRLAGDVTVPSTALDFQRLTDHVALNNGESWVLNPDNVDWIKAQKISTGETGLGDLRETSFDLLDRHTNPSANERVMMIEVLSETESITPGAGIKQTMFVTQEGASLTIVPDYVSIPAEQTGDYSPATAIVVTVGSGANWEIANPEEYPWLVAYKDGANIKFRNLEANDTATPRTARFRVVAEGMEAYLNVTQGTADFSLTTDYADFLATGIAKTGTTNSITIDGITATDEWTVTMPTGIDWFAVDTYTYPAKPAGDGEFTIREVKPNETPNVRTANIAVTSAGMTLYVTVYQDAGAITFDGGSYIYINDSGIGDQTFGDVTTNNGQPWTVAKVGDTSWFEVSRLNTTEFSIAYLANTTKAIRKGAIELRCGDIVLELAVVQDWVLLDFNDINNTPGIGNGIEPVVTLPPIVGDYKLATVDSPEAWTVDDSSEAWIRFVHGDDDYLHAIVTANDTAVERAYTAIVRCGDLSIQFRVIQGKAVMSLTAQGPIPSAGADGFTAATNIQSTSLLGWTNVETDVPWITFPGTAGAYDSDLLIDVEPNPTDVDRTANITVYSGSDKTSFAITQTGTVWTVLSPAEFNSDATNINANFQQTMNQDNAMPWSAVVSDEWISVSPTAGAAGTDITISVTPNPNDFARSGKVTITVGEMEREIVVNQEATVFTVPQMIIFQSNGSSADVTPWYTGDVATPPYTGSLVIQSSNHQDFTIASSDTWLTISPLSGTYDSATSAYSAVSIICAPNTGATRYAIITVKIKDMTRQIHVTQSGNGVNLTMAKYQFDADGTYDFANSLRIDGTPATAADLPLEISPINDLNWEASVDQDWVQVTTGGKEAGEKLDIHVLPNPDGIARYATISVKAGEFTEFIAVEQEAAVLTVELLPAQTIPAVGYPVLTNLVTDATANNIVASNTNGQPWSAQIKGTATWIQVIAGGNSGDPILITAEPNSGATQRTATIEITSGKQTISFSVTQENGVLTVPANITNVPAAGWNNHTDAAFEISTNSGVNWTAESDRSWAVILPDQGESGDDFNLTIEPNPTEATRTATITVKSGTIQRFFTITQEAAAWVEGTGYIPAEGTVIAVAAEGVTGSSLGNVSVTNELPWAATVSATWVHLYYNSGVYDDEVKYDVEPNTGARRTAKIEVTVGDMKKHFTIDQASSVFTKPDNIADVPAEGATSAARTFTYTSTANWSINCPDSWVTAAPATGIKGDSYTITVAPNPTNVARTSTIEVTIGTDKQYFTVSQVAAAWDATMGTSPVTLPLLGAEAHNNQTAVTVNNTNNLSWSAVASEPWISLVSTTGANNTPVKFNIPANTSVSRQGTITITTGSMNFEVIVNQDGGTSAFTHTINLVAKGTAVDQNINFSTGTDWAAVKGAEWMILSPLSGSDNTNISVSANPNPNSGARTAVAVVSTGSLMGNLSVTQEGNVLTLSAASINYENNGTTTDAAIIPTNTAGVNWKASTENDWITVNTPTDVDGNEVKITVEPNPAAVARTGIVTVIVGDCIKTFNVEQEANSIMFVDAAAITTAITTATATPVGVVTPTDINVVVGTGDWTATKDVDWISIITTSGISGAKIDFTVAPNTAAADRVGHITVTSGSMTATLTVTQAHGGITLAPAASSISYAADGSTTATLPTVTTASATTWTLNASETWITVNNPGPNATGDQVDITVATNTSVTSRTGYLTITAGAESVQIAIVQAVGGITFTSDAAGTSVINTISVDAAAANYNTSAYVKTESGHGWTLNTDSPTWITINSTTGANLAAIDFSVTANTGISRSGKIIATADGITTELVVVQGAVSAIAVAPVTIDLDATGLPAQTVDITVAAGATTWTANSGASWLNFTQNGATGTGVMSVSAAPNTTATPRTAIINIVGASGASTILTVTQAAGAITLGLDSQDYLANGTTNEGTPAASKSVSVTVSSGDNWKAEASDSWIVLASGAGISGGNVVIATTPNPGNVARSGSVIIRSGELVANFTVTQQAAAITTTVYGDFEAIGATSPAGEGNVSVTSGLPWTATCEATWVSVVNAGSNVAGDATIQVEPNPDGTPRSTAVVIKSGDMVASIPVNQEAAALTITATAGGTEIANYTIDINANGDLATAQDFFVHNTAGGSWTATADQTWVSISPASGANDTQLKFTVEPNNTNEVRSCSITIVSGGLSKVLVLNQAVGGITASGTTPMRYSATGTLLSGAVNITTASTTDWTVSTTDAWITIVTATAATGTPINITVFANDTPFEREGKLTITNESSVYEVIVKQEVGGISFGTNPVVVPATGSQYDDDAATTAIPDGSVVTIASGLIGTVSTTTPWIQINKTEVISGKSLCFTVQTNTGAARSGEITVTDGTKTATLVVNQGAAIVTLFAADAVSDWTTPTIAAAGTAAVAAPFVETSGSTWEAETSASWVTLSNASGNNGGVVGYALSPNPSGEARTATIVIKSGDISKTASIIQTGAVLTLRDAADGLGAEVSSVNLTTAEAQAVAGPYVWNTNTMPWSAISDVSWITVTPSGANNTQTGYNVTANTGAARTGHITITSGSLSKVYTVIQPSGLVTGITIGAFTTALTAASTATTALVDVTPADYVWTATTATPWISITKASGASGTNLEFTVAPNPSNVARTGSIEVEANGFTSTVSVAQPGAEIAVSTDPAFPAEFTNDGGIADVGVATAGHLTCPTITPSNGMTFTASCPADWVSLINTGTYTPGDGLKLQVQPNGTPLERNTSVAVTCGDMKIYVPIKQAAGVIALDAASTFHSGIYDAATSTWTVPMGGSSATLTIVAPGGFWSAGTTATWIHLISTKATSEDKLEIVVDANPGSERKAAVNIVFGSVTKTIFVTQLGHTRIEGDGVELSPDDVMVIYPDGTTDKEYIVNGDPAVMVYGRYSEQTNGMGDALGYTTTDVNKGPSPLTLTFGPNNTKLDRTATFWYKSGTTECSIKATQAKNEMTVTNPTTTTFEAYGGTGVISATSSNGKQIRYTISNTEIASFTSSTSSVASVTVDSGTSVTFYAKQNNTKSSILFTITVEPVDNDATNGVDPEDINCTVKKNVLTVTGPTTTTFEAYGGSSSLSATSLNGKQITYTISDATLASFDETETVTTKTVASGTSVTFYAKQSNYGSDKTFTITVEPVDNAASPDGIDSKVITCTVKKNVFTITGEINYSAYSAAGGQSGSFSPTSLNGKRILCTSSNPSLVSFSETASVGELIVDSGTSVTYYTKKNTSATSKNVLIKFIPVDDAAFPDGVGVRIIGLTIDENVLTVTEPSPSLFPANGGSSVITATTTNKSQITYTINDGALASFDETQTITTKTVDSGTSVTFYAKKNLTAFNKTANITVVPVDNASTGGVSAQTRTITIKKDVLTVSFDPALPTNHGGTQQEYKVTASLVSGGQITCQMCYTDDVSDYNKFSYNLNSGDDVTLHFTGTSVNNKKLRILVYSQAAPDDIFELHDIPY